MTTSETPHIPETTSKPPCSYCGGSKNLDLFGVVRWYVLSDRLFLSCFTLGLLMVVLGAAGVGESWWGVMTMFIAGLLPIGWGHFKIYWFPFMAICAILGKAVACRACASEETSPSSPSSKGTS